MRDEYDSSKAEREAVIQSRVKAVTWQECSNTIKPCRTPKEFWIMETLIGRPRKARKHVAEELEKKADLAFLERMKKRKTPIGKGIPWQTVKKNLGL